MLQPADNGRTPWRLAAALPYALTVFLSAFLLFQVQPIVGKAILPWFGGTPAVWTTCMLFFQVLLLAGYAYAHLLAARFRPRAQAAVHAAVLVATLFFLNIMPAAHWRPAGGEEPIGRILALLAATVSVPYLALSATGPLLQSWFRVRTGGRVPYRLYALSNAGSLLALVSYPFVFEPALPLSTQARLWAAAYVAFAVCCGWSALGLALRAERAKTGDPSNRTDRTDRTPPSGREKLLWVALAACGSSLLLSTTNQLSMDVSAVPFLWVLPLALYLLSFILCFDSDRWYRRPVWLGLLPLAAAGVAVALLRGPKMPWPQQVALHGVGLFVGCMACHGELARRRPDPRRLTSYYLLIAVGGAMGGIFVSVAAPALFPDLLEYQVTWIVLAAAVLLLLLRSPGSVLKGGRPVWAWSVLALLYAGFGYALLREMHDTLEGQIDSARNFYGVLRVKHVQDKGVEWPVNKLMNGRIVHGIQFVEGPYADAPVSYYSAQTGVGVAVQALRDARGEGRPPLAIGVVGLGAAVMAGWGERGDLVRFYEINPAVVRLADRHFTYRRHARGRVEVAMGDARLSMEREAAGGNAQRYDLLVLDAFSGDAIPLHLLTREAFALYRSRLRDGGVLAIHISNRYLNLSPLVRGLAEECGLEAVRVKNDDDDRTGTDASNWVLATNNRGVLESPCVLDLVRPWPAKQKAIVFSDQFSNLFSLLR